MREVERGARLLVLPGAALEESDDADLARALIAKDPQAPRALWRRFAPMVFRMLRRALGPGHDVEDLAQEVFLCVFEKVPTLREPKALKAFVISITVLTTRSELRRLWVRRWIRLSGKGDPTGQGGGSSRHRRTRGAGAVLRGTGSGQRAGSHAVRAAVHGGARPARGSGGGGAFARDHEAASHTCLVEGPPASRTRSNFGRVHNEPRRR